MDGVGPPLPKAIDWNIIGWKVAFHSGIYFTIHLTDPSSPVFFLPLIGVDMSDSSLYEQVIRCALGQESSDLRVSPTLLGERHSPRRLGQVSDIAPSSLSLGHVTRAVCHGILENLTSMMPPVSLLAAGVKRIMGSGSALSRNEVLRQEVERAFPVPVVYGGDVDSAVGVAMVLCDRF